MTQERMEFEKVNALANKIVTYENQVSKALYDALQTMRSEMSKIYEKYAEKGVLTKAEMARYNRYASMEKQMLSALDPAIKDNLKVIKRLTPEMYNESFFREAWIMDNQAGVNINYGTINKDVILETLADSEYKQIALKRYSQSSILKIRSALVNGLATGQTFTKMMKDLKKAVNLLNYEAMRIIRTEAMTAMNAAADDVYLRAREKGIEGNQIWDATFDARTREDHGRADGQIRDVKTGTFSVGGEKTPYPCWEGLSAGQRINCRCHMRFEIDGYSPQLIRTRENGIIPFQTYEEWKKNYKPKIK